MLCTLAILPKNVIICFVALCPEIQNNFNVDTDALLEYFVNACIGRFLKTLHVVTLYFSSIFGICLIEPTRNYHEQIIESKDGIRTFKDIFACRPNFSKFINVLKKEEAYVRVSILQHHGGHLVQSKILRIIDDYPDRQLLDYLRNIAQNIAF